MQGPGWQGTRSVTVSIGAGGPPLLWEVWPDVLGRGSSQPSLHSRCLPWLLWLSRAKKGRQGESPESFAQSNRTFSGSQACVPVATPKLCPLFPHTYGLWCL